MQQEWFKRVLAAIVSIAIAAASKQIQKYPDIEQSFRVICYLLLLCTPYFVARDEEPSERAKCTYFVKNKGMIRISDPIKTGYTTQRFMHCLQQFRFAISDDVHDDS